MSRYPLPDVMRTSATAPLMIDEVAVPNTGGVIGMTICPGKKDRARNWDRNLANDLWAIKNWGATIVVSLMEEFEFDLLGVPDLGQQVEALGMVWYHLPIEDVSVPGPEFEHQWRWVCHEIHACLSGGGRVLLHCRGGLGRTGIIAARILVQSCLDPIEAMRRVRRSRPGTIQTAEQEEYVLNLAPPWRTAKAHEIDSTK